MVEETPSIENKYTELSDEEKKVEYKKIVDALPEELKTELIPKPEEKPEKPVETSTETVTSSPYKKELDDQTKLIAKTLMADKIEEIKSVYPDYDVKGIVEDETTNELQKVQQLIASALPNAKKMATIEKNLKSENSEGTTSGSTNPKKSPEKPGDNVDKDAGKKMVTEMFEKMGLEEEIPDKPKSE